MLNDIFTRASLLAKLASGPPGPYLPDLVSALLIRDSHLPMQMILASSYRQLKSESSERGV